MRKNFLLRERFDIRGLRVWSPLIIFFFIVKFACPVEVSPFVADPRILIVFFLLFCFFFLPAASHGTERVLGGGVLVRHPPNMAYRCNLSICNTMIGHR